MAWIIARLREKSTWLTLFTLAATVAGLNITPEYQEAIMQAGMGIVAVIAIATREKK